MFQFNVRRKYTDVLYLNRGLKRLPETGPREINQVKFVWTIYTLKLWKLILPKTFHTPLILPTYYIYWAHNIILYSLIVILLLSITRRFFSSTNLWRFVCQYPTASDINVDRFLWNASQVLLQVSQTMNVKKRHVHQRGRVSMRAGTWMCVRGFRRECSRHLWFIRWWLSALSLGYNRLCTLFRSSSEA